MATITDINTRYPDDVLEAIRQFAKEDQRSLNGEVVHILRCYAKERREAEARQKAQEAKA